MIVLDTDVVSEPIRPNADLSVQIWLDRQAADTLYLTAVSLAELLIGVETLPLGRRRNGLEDALARLIERLFGSRILPFDAAAARAHAVIVGRARARGHVLSVADAQIAAIATVQGFAVATRDTVPFTASGVTVINPWQT